MPRRGDVPFPAPRKEETEVDRERSSVGITTDSTGTGKLRSDASSSSVVMSSAGPASSVALLGIEAVSWDQVAFSREFWPLRSHAYCAEDLHLASAFLELTPLTSIVATAGTLLLRVLRFLRLCDYALEDICTILAHASAYFFDVYRQCGNQMEPGEVGNVLASLIFVAHCYVQDETCPLHVWHKHLFRKYCPLKLLNAAVMRLMEIRSYRLRISDSDLKRRLSHLHGSIHRFGTLDPQVFGRFRPPTSYPRNSSTSENEGRGSGILGHLLPTQAQGSEGSYASRSHRYCM
eukprot:TRINITY_DN113155_c0_g1_i1.p1 TRINITY_DN113155_c0_g1~~TRINITY_DN113155_c0_g1_i1.p1  ORF type:complete len:291 (+),score=38.97 TRINITY_DN113155_c0_g1_i1:95-967(+)